MADEQDRIQDALGDRYHILREIGRGGMAVVYLAEDLRHHRKVALKVLKPEVVTALGAGRFAREIEVAGRLQHPNILPLLDSGEVRGFFYYVMPYVEGESLRDRLGRAGELPIPDAVRILIEVADALSEAHARGVVHRDIKPDNVMLRGRHALVMDFGVAKAVTEATGHEMLTSTGVALGTPAYMAPEQATADPHQDHRVDIYALGVLGYELLTSRPPYTAKTAAEMLAAHVTAEPEPLERYRPTVPPALTQVILKCLAKRPADRWQTAEEVVQHLEPLATASGGVTPTQTTPVRPVIGWRRYQHALAIVGASAVVLAGAYFAVAGFRGRKGESQGPSLSAERSVAVLPFRLLSPDSDDAFLPVGLAEDIATTLGQVQMIVVKAPEAVTRAEAATPGDILSIGRTLRVHYVLVGSIRRFRDTLHVSARLVDPSTETQAWGATYDRTTRELVRIPSDVARGLATWLAGVLPLAEQQALDRRPTDNADAYQAYLRGNVKFLLRGRDANLSGLEDYRRALRLDPSFDAARARMALMEAQQEDYHWYPPGTDSDALLRVALARADSVTARDPALPDGWTARCYVLFELGRLVDALDACDEALARNPRDVEANNRRGWTLYYLGQTSAAATQAARTVELDPNWHIPHYQLGTLALDRGRLDEALRQFDEVLRLAPAYATGHKYRGRIRLLQGDTAGARIDLESISAAEEGGIPFTSLRALLLARTGQSDSARAAAARLALESPTDAAIVYASLGDPTGTVRVLETAGPEWADLMAPEFDPIRSDSRFQHIVAEALARRDRR